MLHDHEANHVRVEQVQVKGQIKEMAQSSAFGMRASTCTYKRAIDHSSRVRQHERHTLGIGCKGVLANGTYRTLVWTRVSVGLTRSTLNPVLPS